MTLSNKYESLKYGKSYAHTVNFGEHAVLIGAFFVNAEYSDDDDAAWFVSPSYSPEKAGSVASATLDELAVFLCCSGKEALIIGNAVFLNDKVVRFEVRDYDGLEFAKFLEDL